MCSLAASTHACSAPLSLTGDVAVSSTNFPAQQAQPPQHFFQAARCSSVGCRVGVSRLSPYLDAPPSPLQTSTLKKKRRYSPMKALAAARCTHQRKGSANYFLVRTVSVIKVLRGSVVNADSLPLHTQPMGHEPEQEVAGCPHPHQFTLSHSDTHTFVFLATFTISSWSEDRDGAGCCGHVHT